MVVYPTYPTVPYHACPGRKVTCPDCGQEFHQPRWTGPIWMVPTNPWVTWSYTSASGGGLGEGLAGNVTMTVLS